MWHVRHLGLLAIQTVQRPTRREWGPSLQANNIDPHDVVSQQGRRSIAPTTLKGVCGLRLFDGEIPTS
jgi:hypothetical protein